MSVLIRETDNQQHLVDVMDTRRRYDYHADPPYCEWPIPVSRGTRWERFVAWMERMT